MATKFHSLAALVALTFAGNVATLAGSGSDSGAEGTPWKTALGAGNTVPFAKAFFGVLNGELYLFGSVAESAGSLAGVWRLRNGVWTQLNNLSGLSPDFNGLAPWGAREFEGHLWVGDRRAGALFRLDLDASGNYSTFSQQATVGAEDVFPGPTVWGKLWLGTFENPGAGLDGARYLDMQPLADLHKTQLQLAA